MNLAHFLNQVQYLTSNHFTSVTAHKSVSIQERKQRQFAEREQQFLDAAKHEICQRGILAVQMARIARQCDYSTGTLYQHFASKEDLFVALNAEMAAQRTALFERVRQWRAPTRDRMFALTLADTLFAQRQPEHFRLSQYVTTEVIWQAASPERRQQCLEAHRPLGEVVEQVVREAIDKGDLPNPQQLAPLELAIGQWAMGVGMHTLVHAEGLLQYYDLNQPYELLLQHVQRHLNALNWQPLFDENKNTTQNAERLNHYVAGICNTLFTDLCSNHQCRDNDASNAKRKKPHE
ncbi:AcrR transcription regulator family protein [gamma proteobacterium HTCC5015]|nr:AcrR transcription regulator family protein [gamma proteobacterium HTCC5015]